jgi:hypothetical protein
MLHMQCVSHRVLTARLTAVLLQDDDGDASSSSSTTSISSSIAIRIVSEGESRLLSIIAVVPDPQATSTAASNTAQDQSTTVGSNSRYAAINSCYCYNS